VRSLYFFIDYLFILDDRTDLSVLFVLFLLIDQKKLKMRFQFFSHVSDA